MILNPLLWVVTCSSSLPPPVPVLVVSAFEPSAIFFYVKDQSDGEHPDDLHAIELGNIEQHIKIIKNLLQAIGEGNEKSLANTLHPLDDNICNSIN